MIAAMPVSANNISLSSTLPNRILSVSSANAAEASVSDDEEIYDFKDSKTSANNKADTYTKKEL